MAIQLTPEQRQAVREGRPVEVHDPEGDLRGVLISAQENARFHPPAPPSSAPERKTPAVSLPVRLADLPITSELRQQIEVACKEHWYSGGMDRDMIEHQLKLKYYFPNRIVGLLETPDGYSAIAAGIDYEDFELQLKSFPAEVRLQVVPWPVVVNANEDSMIG